MGSSRAQDRTSRETGARPAPQPSKHHMTSQNDIALRPGPRQDSNKLPSPESSARPVPVTLLTRENWYSRRYLARHLDVCWVGGRARCRMCVSRSPNFLNTSKTIYFCQSISGMIVASDDGLPWPHESLTAGVIRALVFPPGEKSSLSSVK